MDLKKILSRKVRGKLMDSLTFLPDELYIRLFFFAVTGKTLNLKDPQTFEEKQQWLKLHDQHPEYSELVDKLAVRKHIDECLGKGHCFPLLGVWDRFEDIDFKSLPDEFALKCNHDSGSTKIIHNKSFLTESDISALEKHFNARLKQDFFKAGREYPYKGIKPCIIAEQLMHDAQNPEKDIEDYKFFCFDGEPKIMFVATDRSTDCRFDFFDMDFHHLDITNIHPQSGKTIEKPAQFDKMKQIAAKLSKGMKFVRVDLYQLNGNVYFGEYTFFHGGGFCEFYPKEWENRLGEWIQLEK